MTVRSIALIAALALPAAAQAKRVKLKKLDVSELAVQVASGTLCAGQDAQLSIAATLGDGTVLQSRAADGSKGELRPGDFKVSVDLGELDGKERLLVENTGLELLNRQVTVVVEGKGTTLQATAPLDIGFGCAIALDYSGDAARPGSPWVPPRAERDLAEIEAHREETGQMGPRPKDLLRAALPIGYAVDNLTAGSPGLAGPAGESGARGGPGQAGAVGGAGGAGLPGRPGQDLVVDVGTIAADSGPLVLVSVTPSSGPARTVLLDPDAGGRLELVARGGRGGSGGKGGNGGSGGNGDASINYGHGGDGAAGGPGGSGGEGGTGGTVQIRYDSAQPHLAQLVTADVKGGDGGSGGRGGEFGAGGIGIEGADNGSMGSTDSADGAYGAAGPAGSVQHVPTAAPSLFAGLNVR